MGPGDDSSKFHTITPIVEQPFAPGKKPITGDVYGLVGFHIMVRIESAPQWVWATFEHINNGPVVDLREGVPTKVTAKGNYNFWNDQGERSFGGFDPDVYQKLSTMESAPNYYEPIKLRSPSQITRVITENNAVSESKWTKNLNKVMQENWRARFGKITVSFQPSGPVIPKVPALGTPLQSASAIRSWKPTCRSTEAVWDVMPERPSAAKTRRA